MIYLSIFNASVAFLHWHFRKEKFTKKEKSKLAIDIGCSIIPAVALIWLNGYYTAFAAFAFWALMTELNIKANNRLGVDTYNKQWHLCQWLQWVSFHVMIALACNWQFSLMLFGVAVFLFDGLQNIYWVPGGKRPWFYVGLHSGGIDTWINKISQVKSLSFIQEIYHVKKFKPLQKIKINLIYWIFGGKTSIKIKRVIYIGGVVATAIPFVLSLI